MKKWAVIFVCVLFSMESFATEITVLSAGMRNEKQENGDVVNKTRSLTLGLGIENNMGGALANYFNILLEQINYSGDSDLDDATNFKVEGGIRHYFDGFSERIMPYLGLGVAFVSEKQYENLIQIDQSGIFYGMDFGLKFLLGNLKSFDLNDWNPFFTVNFTFFSSSLTSTTKAKQVQADGSMTTIGKTTKNEFYIDNTSPWDSVTLGLGLRI